MQTILPGAPAHATLARAIAAWTDAAYPGETAHVEALVRDPASSRPHTWSATVRLSNGVRLCFTVVLHEEGAAWVTRCARLGGRADVHVSGGGDRHDALAEAR
jgi:hypothetical protein